MRWRETMAARLWLGFIALSVFMIGATARLRPPGLAGVLKIGCELLAERGSVSCFLGMPAP